MKEFLKTLIRSTATPLDGKNVAREYLQARILASMQHSGAFVPLAFHGGTALRFLYQVGRYSEDLDFSLVGNSTAYNLHEYAKAVQSEMALENYQIDCKIHDQKTVQSAQINFPGLLFELGLSAQSNENLSIRIEVDINPPSGAGLATTVVRRHVILHLQHHDKATLLAGKIHAVLQRPFTKGRDIYDLLWYLSDPAWPTPNLVYLNNALAQTHWQNGLLLEDTWKTIIWKKLETLDWNTVREDVRPFLEPSFDLTLLNREIFEGLLKSNDLS